MDGPKYYFCLKHASDYMRLLTEVIFAFLLILIDAIYVILPTGGLGLRTESS